MFSLLCPDSQIQFLGMFDLSIAPPLLFYAYIPIILLCIYFGIFVLVKSEKLVASKYFVFTTFSFAVWIVLILFQWIASYVGVVHLAWQLLIIPEILIYLFSVIFCYTFLFQKDLSNRIKYFLGFIYLIPVVLLASKLNITSFDLINCEGNVGKLWDMTYIFELISLLMIPLIAFEKFKKSSTHDERAQAVLLPTGIFIFLGIFWASNFFGEITKTYEINLIGPIGMVCFLGIMSYLIVKFRVFNIKLIAAQALVISLIILIGSQFFFIQTNTNRILTAITLIITGVIGINLIRSVKKENELNESLQIANEGQSNLIHIMNHQIKGYLSKSRNIFAELLSENGYGINDESRPMIKEGFESLTEGVGFVQQILNGSSAETGALIYAKNKFDMKELVVETVQGQKDIAEKAGLTYEVKIDDGDYKMMGDNVQLKESVRNLIDNSIRYTPKGGLKIHLSKNGDKILFSVEDTGVGIAPEDRPKLFTKGGRGKDSLKININSTGYGLAFVKAVVEAHKGRVWVDSKGTNQGSTFYMELPVVI